MTRMPQAFLATLVLLALPSMASAQFQGDVFFAQPSVSAPEGGTATLEVLMFSGADVVGATDVDVVYDPTQADIVVAQPGTTAELAGSFASVASSGRLSTVNLNGSSLSQPFGTVSLSKLQVRPKVPAGSTVTLNLQVRSVLRQDTTSFPSTQGFSGEILVTSAGSQAASLENPGVNRNPNPELARRALAFRRPGLVVDLLDFEVHGSATTAVPHRWVMADPAAPHETAQPPH